MSWPLVKLAEVCTFENGDRGTNYPSKDEYVQNGVPFINAGNLGENGIDKESLSFITKEKFDVLSNGKVRENDILFCLRGSLGKFAIVEGIPEGAIASSLIIIRATNLIHIDYLFNYFRSSICQKEIDKFENGAAQPNLSGRDLKEFKIPLPPLAEQKRIAAILDKADAIRRKRQQAIKLADEFLRSVFLEMFGDPVTNPKGFPVGTIRDMVESANYGTSGKASETEGEFPILRMGNITYEGGWNFDSLKYIDMNEKEKDKYLVKNGDLVFNRTNSKELVGKTAVFEDDRDMVIAGYLIRVRCNGKGNTRYISGYLNSKHGKKTLEAMCKSIVGMANINAQELQDIKVLIPPIELQNKFAELVMSCNQKVEHFNQAEDMANNLFESLSQKAFSGSL